MVLSSLERVLDGVTKARPSVVPGLDVGVGAEQGVARGGVSSGGQSEKGVHAAPSAPAILGGDRYVQQKAGGVTGLSSSHLSVTFDSRAAFEVPTTGHLKGYERDRLDWQAPEGIGQAIDPKIWDELGVDPRAAFALDLNLNEDKVCKERPEEPARPKSLMETLSDRARSQMQQMLNAARRSSAGRRPDGRCYNHVWRFISSVGYGSMPYREVPAHSHGRYAKQFAYYANHNLDKLGLVKLPISNPYQAPPGAIVVVRAGTPGTAHPVAGDIAVAAGNGRFYNGGEMSYGGPHHFPPGNNYVLGIYVPK
jgi:hypothetical protein